jgi:hypothetical protein
LRTDYLLSNYSAMVSISVLTMLLCLVLVVMTAADDATCPYSAPATALVLDDDAGAIVFGVDKDVSLHRVCNATLQTSGSLRVKHELTIGEKLVVNATDVQATLDAQSAAITALQAQLVAMQAQLVTMQQSSNSASPISIDEPDNWGKFDEGSGVVSAGSSRACGFNWDIHGDVTWTAGRIGTGALHFAGENTAYVKQAYCLEGTMQAYYRIVTVEGTTSGLRLRWRRTARAPSPKAMTVSLWFKTTNSSGGMLGSARAGSEVTRQELGSPRSDYVCDQGWNVRMIAGGSVRFWKSDGQTDLATYTAPDDACDAQYTNVMTVDSIATGLNDDEWHHVAVTVGACNDPSCVYMYIDGVEGQIGSGDPGVLPGGNTQFLGLEDFHGLIVGNLGEPEPLVSRVDGNGNPYYINSEVQEREPWSGGIDDVRVFWRRLTTSEITELAEA